MTPSVLAAALSATLIGLQAHPVRVEVAAVRGPPFFELVGLAEAAVRESRVRVKSALAQVDVHINECGIVVNLAPCAGYLPDPRVICAIRAGREGASKRVIGRVMISSSPRASGQRPRLKMTQSLTRGSTK
jgi:hypothetical protein